MKKLLPTLLALATLPATADEDVDEAAIAVFESFQSAFQEADAAGIAQHFHKKNEVSLSLHKSGSFSPEQAKGVLKEYFEKVTVDSLAVPKEGYKGGSSPSVTYTYKYTDANGRQQTARLLVQLQKVEGRWIISRIHLMGR